LSNTPVLDHVALAVPDISQTAELLVRQLGGRPAGSGPGGGFRFWQFSFGGGGVLEVLEPDGPANGFVHRFLERRGPGIHHVTFKVPSIEAAIRRAEEHDYEVVNVDLSFPSWKEAFLHPKQAQGIVVQLAESHPELEPELPDDAFPFPPLPEPATEPARVVGLRMLARSAERARHQWESTLGGECHAGDGELMFRWPDSPLRVAVRVDPGAAADDALAVEVATDRRLPAPLLAVSD